MHHWFVIIYAEKNTYQSVVIRSLSTISRFQINTLPPTPIFPQLRFSFITSLHKLIEHCDYGALKDEMIRDKIVVGLCDEQLSEKLQLDPNLTLKRAVDQARQREAVRKQQAVVRCNPPGVTTNVDAMRSKPKSSRHATTKHQKTYVSEKCQMTQKSSCRRCGKEMHQMKYCPAKDAKCHKCSKTGHFGAMCLTKKHWRSA